MKKYILITTIIAVTIAGMISPITVRSQSEDDSLVAKWRFDESSSSIAYDSSGLGNNGYLTNMDTITCWVNGKIKGALKFDGIDDYVNCGNDASFNITNNLTIEMWIKFDTLTAQEYILHNGLCWIFHRGDWAGDKVYFLYRIAEPVVAGESDWTNWAGVKTPMELQQGKWYYLAAVMAGDTMRMYVNGIKVSENTGLSGYTKDPSQITNLYIGKTPFKGMLDEVVIHKRVLSKEEIKANSIINANGRNYYVSLIGNNGNPGTITLPWRTITYAASMVQAGDTVYIKAGNYGHEHVVIGNSGTSSEPIVFSGYKNTPGDIPTPLWLDLHKPGGYDPPTIDPNEMPLIDGVDGTGYGINIFSKAFVVMKNFQVTKYDYGIELNRANNVIVDNMIVTSSEVGIELRECTDSKILNSAVTDCEWNNYSIRTGTQDCLLENSRSHDAGSLDTDYHIVVHDGGCHDNTIRHCLAQNNNPSGGGSAHGIGVKIADVYPGTEDYNNTIEDCVVRTAYDCFYTRHDPTHNNQFINCTAYNDGPSSGPCNGFVIGDGAHDNKFILCRTVNTVNSVLFYDSKEIGGQTYIGENNTFINCIFDNSQNCAIHFYYGSNSYNSPALNNKFINCVFAKGDILFYEETSNNIGNVMRNCIVTDFSTLRTGSGTGGLEYSYSDFFNNTFSSPSGTGNISQDPLFADAENSDFHLQSQYGRWNGSSWVNDAVTSPCIDAGDPLDDYSNEPLLNGGRINMGAYGNTTEASKSAGTTGEIEEQQLITEFALHQNYPNPFNPETNITFDLPTNSFVSLKIFSPIGNEVATLVNEQLSAGTHSYKVESEKFGLASAVYFYRLMAGEFVQTRKMLMIK